MLLGIALHCLSSLVFSVIRSEHLCVLCWTKNLFLKLLFLLSVSGIFEDFLRAYIDHFKYQTITTEDFRAYLYNYFEGKVILFHFEAQLLRFYFINNSFTLIKNYVYVVISC